MTPMGWDNPINIIVLGPKILKEIKQEATKTRQNLKADQNMQNLKATQDRRKGYVDKNRMHKEF